MVATEAPWRGADVVIHTSVADDTTAYDELALPRYPSSDAHVLGAVRTD